MVEPAFDRGHAVRVDRPEKRMMSALEALQAHGVIPMESVSQLAKKAIELEPVERIQLVEAILRSLDKAEQDIERSWVAESEARYAAYKRGEIDSTNWEEISKASLRLSTMWRDPMKF